MENERQDRLLAGIRSVFSAVLKAEPSSIGPGSDMASVAGWDSLSHLAIIAGIEAHFKVRLTLAELRRLDSVDEILALLRSKGA